MTELDYMVHCKRNEIFYTRYGITHSHTEKKIIIIKKNTT